MRVFQLQVSNVITDIACTDYGDRAYNFQTQNFVMDKDTTLTVNDDGTFRFNKYEIRFNENKNGIATENFDFEGGKLSPLFNLIAKPILKSDNAKPVNFVYEGEGFVGKDYTNEDYENWENNKNGTNKINPHKSNTSTDVSFYILLFYNINHCV